MCNITIPYPRTLQRAPHPKSSLCSWELRASGTQSLPLSGSSVQPTDGPPLGQQRQGKGRANTWCKQAAKPSVGPGVLQPFRSSLEGFGEKGRGSQQVSRLPGHRPGLPGSLAPPVPPPSEHRAPEGSVSRALLWAASQEPNSSTQVPFSAAPARTPALAGPSHCPGLGGQWVEGCFRAVHLIAINQFCFASSLLLSCLPHFLAPPHPNG